MNGWVAEWVCICECVSVCLCECVSVCLCECVSACLCECVSVWEWWWCGCAGGMFTVSEL